MFFLLGILPAALGHSQTVIAEKPGFRALVPEDAAVEKLAGGFGFVEGPAWNTERSFLVFSDIPADKMYRYDPATGAVAVFREPSHNANGNFYDFAGDLYTCEHGSRQVILSVATRSREPGHAAINSQLQVADRFEGKRLNSPNDVVVKSDGTVWFTDPTYGLGKAPKEQSTNNVYCFDPKTERLRAVATDFDQPNGLCFSPDERKLYVADSGQLRHVRVFDVSADDQLSGGSVFCAIDKGVPDGMRCDALGNLWSSAGDGVQVFDPAGERLGKILVPETPANLCFGGMDGQHRTDLYLTARTSLYRVKVKVAGAR